MRAWLFSALTHNFAGVGLYHLVSMEIWPLCFKVPMTDSTTFSQKHTEHKDTDFV